MDEFINSTLFGNPLYLWLIFLLVTLLVLLLFGLLRWVIARRFVEPQGAQRGLVSELLVGMVTRTRPYFMVVVALYIASRWLVLSPQVMAVARMAAITVTLLQVGVWGAYLISYSTDRKIRVELERDNANATTLGGLALVARIALWAVLILMILENVTGIQMNTLVTSLGITGIAVALAVQNILSDLFASLSITLDRPFVIGDFITVGEFSGTVEHIGLKSTRIRSLSGEQLVFSNSDLLGSRIRNFKRMNRRRAAFTLGITFQTSADKVERVPDMIEKIIYRQPDVTFDRAHLKEIGSSALMFEAVYFIETPDYLRFMNTQQAINFDILREFEREGIELAYPTQMVIERASKQRA